MSIQGGVARFQPPAEFAGADEAGRKKWQPGEPLTDPFPLRIPALLAIIPDAKKREKRLC